MWMKKRYVLKFEDEQQGAVVARQGTETAVQVCDECEMTSVNYHTVLSGKAISLRYGGRLHLIHITGLDNNGNLAITMNGRPVQLSVMDELKAQALDSLGSATGSGTIAADIPGLVVEIKVQEGEKVHQGEPVIVIEAMKMQNELVAAVSGTVTGIPVEKGQAVNPGDPLIIIEPEPGG
ncbi:MAG: biotin/lipoyl-binding protein [Gemmatimonadales bacterium]|nr:biotin/lipoyl-binding protein [Gemmatimonadales bacterium]